MNVSAWHTWPKCLPEGPYTVNTHAFHLKDGKEASSHQHAKWDGEDQDKGQGQRGFAGLHCPQDAQADNLD